VELQRVDITGKTRGQIKPTTPLRSGEHRGGVSSTTSFLQHPVGARKQCRRVRLHLLSPAQENPRNSERRSVSGLYLHIRYDKPRSDRRPHRICTRPPTLPLCPCDPSQKS